MKKTKMQLLAMSCLAAITFSGTNLNVIASSKVTSVLPSAGISYALSSEQVSLSDIQEEVVVTDDSSEANSSTAVVESAKTITDTISISDSVKDTILKDIVEATGANIEGEESSEEVVIDEEAVDEETADDETESFKNLVIAQVNDYVNVRDNPSEDEGEIIGKLYDDSVGTFIEEVDGWYKIKSGSVEGYVKAEYCVTGDDAVALAQEVGTRIATVTTTTLKVRSGPSTDDEVLGLVPIEDELIVVEELDGWVKVSIEFS